MDKRLEALQGRNLPRRSLAIFSFPITKVIGRSAVKSDPISSFPIRKVQYNVARSLSEPLKTLPRNTPCGNPGSLALHKGGRCNFLLHSGTLRSRPLLECPHYPRTTRHLFSRNSHRAIPLSSLPPVYSHKNNAIFQAF